MTGIVLTLLLGLFLLAGALLAASSHNHHLIEQLSIAIALGTMSGLAVLELIPEAIEHLQGHSLAWLPFSMFAGIVVLKILDHYVPEHDHEHGFHHDCSEQNVIHIGIISSIAVILHNIIEGMAVYAVTKESVSAGILIALGVGLHNIPMGMVIFATLEHEDKNRKVTLLAASALSTFVGGIVMALFWGRITNGLIGILISLTLGMILYIILFELIPHLMHGKKKGLSLAGTILGVLLIIVSSIFG